MSCNGRTRRNVYYSATASARDSVANVARPAKRYRAESATRGNFPRVEETQKTRTSDWKKIHRCRPSRAWAAFRLDSPRARKLRVVAIRRVKGGRGHGNGSLAITGHTRACSREHPCAKLVNGNARQFSQIGRAGAPARDDGLWVGDSAICKTGAPLPRANFRQRSPRR